MAATTQSENVTKSSNETSLGPAAVDKIKSSGRDTIFATKTKSVIQYSH